MDACSSGYFYSNTQLTFFFCLMDIWPISRAHCCRCSRPTQYFIHLGLLKSENIFTNSRRSSAAYHKEPLPSSICIHWLSFIFLCYSSSSILALPLCCCYTCGKLNIMFFFVGCFALSHRRRCLAIFTVFISRCNNTVCAPHAKVLRLQHIEMCIIFCIHCIAPEPV